jgi:hypothetical protein
MFLDVVHRPTFSQNHNVSEGPRCRSSFPTVVFEKKKKHWTMDKVKNMILSDFNLCKANKRHAEITGGGNCRSGYIKPTDW